MRRPKKDIQLTSYDELLGLEETSEKSMNQVVEIELEKLYPFKNHPFHVNDDEKMAETVESIKTYGVLTPALVRPRPDVILLSYFMEMNDADIARKLNLVRSTVHEHRTRSLEILKAMLEENVNENGRKKCK